MRSQTRYAVHRLVGSGETRGSHCVHRRRSRHYWDVLAVCRGNYHVGLEPRSSTNDAITNYNVYYGVASATYTNSAAAGTNLTVSISNLVEGVTYYFAATAVDTNGLESDYSNEVSTNTALPTIVLTSPANSAAYAAPANISLAASVTANGHSITAVQFYNGTTLLGTDTTAPYTFAWSSVPAGSYSLTAHVVYDSGSTVTSAAANVTVTNLPAPTIALTSPANHAAFTAPATINLAASVTANGHTITSVQFYNGTTLLGTDTTAPYSFAWSSVPAGSYSLTARLVYDTTNTLASTAANVSVTNLPTPAITLTSPANNETFTAPATVSLAASVSANGHSITAVQFYNGTNLLGQDSTAPYALTWTNVPAGTYSLTAQAVYGSGTTVASAAANVLVVAARPPNTPPTISAIADQTTTQDTPTAAIPFTVGDAQTVASNLTLFAASADPTIVPTNNIVFGGSDSNRTVTLTPVSGATGTVAITVFVSDEAGLTTNTTFQLTVQATPPSATPALAVVGDGTISSGQDTQTLTPGQVYTVTAVPAEGQEFTGWSGSIFSSNPRLTFVMQSNLVLKATFTSLGHAAGGIGRKASSIYNGLFFPQDAVSLTNSGSFALSVTPRGRYSGHILLGTKRYAFSGLLDTNLNSGTNIILRHNDTTLSLDFEIGGSQKDQLSGHLTPLTNGDWVALLSGDLAVFGGTNRAPFAGGYTLVIPGYDGVTNLPAGDGFGTLRVNSAGQVTFVGTLADGVRVSQSALVSSNGYWPLYLPLYSGNGCLMSWLAFASNTTNDLNGSLTWLKQAGTKSKYYPDGFACQCDVFGSIYVRTNSVLNLLPASLMFCGGEFPSAITNLITIGPGNRLVMPNKDLRLSFSLSTGTFNGSFFDSVADKWLAFSGAVFQRLNTACGVLLGSGDQTSEVTLAP